MIDLPKISHGHVVKNKSGTLARCGGPAICSHCQLEAELCILRDTVAALRTGKAKWEARYASMTHSLGCDACEANQNCEEGDRLATIEARAEQADEKTKKGGG